MTEEQKNKIRNRITLLSLAVILLLAACLIFLVVTNRASMLLTAVSGSFFLAVYWLISDVLSVIWLKSFEGKSEEQKKAYYIYALMDLVGFGGLIYFVIDTDSMLGVLIFVACTVFRRRFYDTFTGKSAEEAGEASGDEIVSESENTGNEVIEEPEDAAEESEARI